MPEKSKIRATSASHQPYQQQRTRRSSFNDVSRKTYHHPTIAGSSIVLPVVDLRTLPQKIEDLEAEMLELKNDKNSEQELHHLVLMQVYCNLQYGDISIENVRAYLNLSKYYYHRKLNYLAQAKFHALNARDIFEQLNIKSDNKHLNENLLAYDIYLLLVQCSLNAKQREKKTKNKHILAIDKSHIDHDLKLMKKYLENLQHLMASDKYKKFYFEYLFLKFDAIVLDVKRFNQSITEIIDEIVKYLNNNNIKNIIDFYLRCGSYYLNFDEYIQEGLTYYRKAVEFADEQTNIQPSYENKKQLANAILQRCIAKVQTNRLTDDLESEFQRAIHLYQQLSGQMNKNLLKALDELANFYIKSNKYQDALNVLCENLSDKIQLYGDFSDEVIQTESLIGSLYLREGESLNAAGHLKTCLDLQEFVYGPNDSRTCETRKSVEILKKDPVVLRTFYTRIQDRPAFRTCKKISYEKDDLHLIQRKPRN